MRVCQITLLFGKKTSFNVKIMFDLCSCINNVMSSCLCIALWVSCYLLCSPLLLCFGRSRSWSASKVLRRFSATFAATKQAYFPFFVHISWPMFSPKYFYTEYCIRFQSLLGNIRVSYQLHKLLEPLPVPYLLSIGFLCWPEYKYICYILMLRPA